ncbi:hypothetical protein M407DRAFT_26212 [Tulasnella calospora MUT 4182]|uniref:Pseudouridine synthase RsuA/RluA-like domain-containing protein n=1 Tax=Tulasnella calospora MUT 4182 TaxID=1051891 RepID=A0A0C3QG62_9AGAM|nr:hypothetical protein M407DRAFT_26212 [Tulasnella calospora MUT 4182]
MSILSSSLAALKKLNVVYADRSLVVLNKPAGLLMQGTVSLDPAKRAGTIQPILEELQDILKQNQPLRTIHRLDRDTTGVVLLARNPRIVTEMHQQMSTGQAQKTYLALVNDAPLRVSKLRPGPTTGRITTPLIIDPRGHVSVGSPGTTSSPPETSKTKPASTTYEILTSSVSHQLSLVQLGLETGYKHQLRVHLAQAIGCPILGDTKYGGDAVPGVASTGLGLHCRTISLMRYKKDGPKKRFELSISAALPSNFAEICLRHGITLPPQARENVIQLDGQPCSSEQLLHYTGGVTV